MVTEKLSIPIKSKLKIPKKGCLLSIGAGAVAVVAATAVVANLLKKFIEELFD